ncbi:MAG: hypothetical protein KAH48_05035, partial [Chlorobi bacterium]|nr:hypothetical protein [Chlorobiota bacterium]
GGIDIFEFEVRDEIDSVEQILSAWGQNTSKLITYKNIKMSHLSRSFGLGNSFWKEDTAEPEDFVSINIRFGKDSAQMAHRFGLNEDDYEYKDYIEVPFEVWDTKNNKQLAVSFYDYNDNGEFDLLAKNPEMLFIHAADYNPDKENKDVSVKNGVKHSNIYVFAPLLKSGFEWGVDSIPDCRIIVNYGNWYWRERATKAVTAVYGQYPSNNGRNDVHPDQHNITIIPIDEETGEFQMLVGNDGGIVYSTDMGNTWHEKDRGTGYNTSQFYGADKCPGKDEYIGGTQDNGTWMSIAGLPSNNMTPYNMVLGGDGFEVSWHYKDPLKVIGGSQFNGLGRTTNGGASWVSATKGLADIGSGKGVFITRIAKSQADPELLFAAGRSGLWRSENFAESWSLTDIPDSVWSGNGYFQ